MKKLLPLLILFQLAICSFAFATGTIKGNITDNKTGEPLVGATVKLKSKDKDFKMSTGVGLDGSFIFKNVPAGKYEIEAKYISFEDQEANVEVQDGAIASVKLSLSTKERTLTEVNISGHADKTSDKAAQTAERNSPQILNAVSARTIEASPDITIANVTQRISGVSVERSTNGEAQYPIIRGMDSRYIYTLVNGVKIPSPDNKNRYIPLDIFPADIVDRLEVSKSLTANMEGDAIGGAINLVLKDAPDDFTIRANAGTGLAANFFGNGFTQFDHSASLKSSPRATNGNNYQASVADFPNNPFHYSQNKVPLASIFGLSIGGRSKNKKFGAIVSGSYQNTYRQTNSTFFNTDVNLANNEPVVTDVSNRVYNIQQQRLGLISKFDYKFNRSNKISFDADYINLTQNEYRFSSDTSLQLGRAGIGTGRVNQDYRSDRTVQKIYNFNLHGDHRLNDKLSINWTALYSKATANEPDRADLSLNTGRNVQSDGTIVQAPFTFDALKAQTRIFSNNADRDKTGFLNLIYSPIIFGADVELSAGGMYRDKTRHSIYDEYDLRPGAANTAQTFDGNIDNNTFDLFNTQGTSSDALNYDFTERVGAGYGQFKFTAGKLLAIGGLRYEHTSQAWHTGAPLSVAGTDGSIKYYDLLPSVNLKYNLSDKQDIRLSYYSAVSRPNFYELIPHTSGDPDADYKEQGNPNLKRITAENFDLRYELFPKALDQLLVGVFYKSIKNPIEYAIEPSGTDFAYKPENFGNAHNLGFELDITKYFRNFGIRANYTYTDSKITTDKQQDYRDDNGFLTHRTVSQTRSLQGQSKNIANLSFLYRDSKNGFNAQISAVYTGARINTVSPFLDNDIWQKGYTSLDFSADKRLFGNLSVYVKATNLLNTAYQLEIRRPYPADGQVVEHQEAGKNTFVRQDLYRQYYIVGLRYKL
ncbi:TonB-dependent receptor [Mucilaginibacter sp. FT3.2]|uniref:TonB-dependent receptor n=1 Tax=Mucilaginibacter sp. FT3.2 TaxID=2723090 RepID=UPI00161072FE|nr:TonB-dependent receptor [Mucilaginibacter sp. FT3.2]MBB6229625.1 outer membrane receptor protein involved in Fe transport [Mucilaginibacter sp. FT3.2]